MNTENLSRNWKRYPRKKGEVPPKKDIEYLYIELNLKTKDVYEYFEVGYDTFLRWLKCYGIRKPRKLVKIQTDRDYQQKYGMKYSASCKEIREKINTTKSEKYGTKCNFSIDYIERSKTWMEKYGVDNPAKHPLLRIKGLKTCLEKYGVESFTQTQEYKRICKENREQRINKCYETKKKNGTFNVSAPEERCFEKLVNKFQKVERQYKSEKYPFACDFYPI